MIKQGRCGSCKFLKKIKLFPKGLISVPPCTFSEKIMGNDCYVRKSQVSSFYIEIHVYMLRSIDPCCVYYGTHLIGLWM